MISLATADHVRRFGVWDALKREHEFLTKPSLGIGHVTVKTDAELDGMRTEIANALTNGDVNEALRVYAVLRAEPDAPVGPFTYKLFLKAAHDEKKPEVRAEVLEHRWGLCWD